MYGNLGIHKYVLGNMADVQRVIDILGQDLGFGFFSFYDAVRSTLLLDYVGDMMLCGDMQRVDRVLRGISQYLFMIRNENEHDSKVEDRNSQFRDSNQ